MNPDLCKPEVIQFLEEQEQTPLDRLLFKGSPFPTITIQELAQQLEGRKKAKDKLPLWYEHHSILYPPQLNLGQTSSQATAQYKASIIIGSTLADITGGLGVDSYFFAQKVDTVHYFEKDALVYAFAKANFKTLQANNVHCHQGDGISGVLNANMRYDTIYLDPGRRHKHKGKVFRLEDCEPDIVVHQTELLAHCNALWVKTAPLLDITAGLKALLQVTEIHIIAVKNEVKELLWKLEPQVNTHHIPKISTINIIGNKSQSHTFLYKAYTDQEFVLSIPKQYLYEPNAALMKSGAFHWIAHHFSLHKLHQHAHLFTSDRVINFPGRVFEIEKILPYSPKRIKKLKIIKANITTRNFKLTVAQLRKQLQIKEGGDLYLFFTTLMDGQLAVLFCKKQKT